MSKSLVQDEDGDEEGDIAIDVPWAPDWPRGLPLPGWMMKPYKRRGSKAEAEMKKAITSLKELLIDNEEEMEEEEGIDGEEEETEEEFLNLEEVEGFGASQQWPTGHAFFVAKYL